MKKNYYSTKFKQLKVLSRRVQLLLKRQNKEALLQLKRLKIIIYRLLNELRFYHSKLELKKVLGSAALLFGLAFSNNVSAQWFDAPLTNPFGIDSTYNLALPEFADLDNDGDLDLLVGEYYGNLQYFENTGSATDPSFNDPISNPFGLSSGSYFAIPAFADLDNDGDLDLMLGEYYGALQYFENTGSASSPAFAAPITNPFEIVATNNFASLEFVDLDNDGDYDILLGDYTIETNNYYDYQDPLFQYYENIGNATSPEFAPPIENPFGLESPDAIPFPSFADLDDDGDFDMIVGQTDYASYYETDGILSYYENTGTASAPEFAAPIISPFGLTPTYYLALPALADLDNDGDFDLLAGEYYGAMKYFENVGTVGISDINSNVQFSLYPNPVNDVLMIDSEESIKRIEVIDILGKKCIDVNDPPSMISFGDLKNGMYMLNITFSDGSKAFEKVLKE